jgi:predicted phage terminase large subunit-like protein
MRYEEDNPDKGATGFVSPRKSDRELLWPNRMGEEQVQELEAKLGPYATAAQLQQRPAPRGGGMFPVDLFVLWPSLPRDLVTGSVLYWDKAATQGAGCWTAGTLMHQVKGRGCGFVIEQVVRGRWAVGERDVMIKNFSFASAQNNPTLAVWVEQEPGSGGKESAESTIRQLAGIRCFADKVTGDKLLRADPFASQVQGGNVALVDGEWVRAFKQECEMFPNGEAKDQVDSAGGAFAQLVKRVRGGAWGTEY